MATRQHDRAAAFSVQLAQAHQDLRGRLHRLRAELGRPQPGGTAVISHCLAFCGALTAHHQGEDTGMFTELLRVRPDLADTVGKLVQDHDMITWILSRVAELAGTAAGLPSAGPPDAAALEAIGRELDGLAAIMESHFRYEERAISAALDAAVPDTGWSQTVFRPGPR